MNPTHLAAFRAVAESGGFLRAAESLLISQPAVSAHVAALERELGVRLFDRLPRGAALTEAGRLLLSFARRMDAVEAEARAALADLATNRRGRLTIGASTTVGVYLLPELLGRYRAAYPGVELTTVIDNTDAICTRLRDDALDIAVTEGQAPDPALGLDTSVVRDDELVVITPRGHPLAARRRVSAGMLASEPFLEREPGSGTRAVVERAFIDAGVNRRIALVLGHTEAIKRGVIAGLGIAVVSQLAVRDERDAGRLVVIRPVGIDLRRPLHLLTRSGRSLSSAAQHFVGFLHSL